MTRLINSKAETSNPVKKMNAGFDSVSRSGDIVIETKQLSVGYDDNPLFEKLDWQVRRGEKWGIIGENGSGKSTLLKVILGLLKPMSGIAKLGSNVEAGYFSQNASDLDPDSTPLETLVEELEMEVGAARNLLGRFVFSGDQVFQNISTLSGGERNKLSLAKLTKLNPNLLVLDEPTNHLDLSAREVLCSVLSEYSGTLLVVSHDRWLLTELTTHVLEIRRGMATKHLKPFGEVSFQAGVQESKLSEKRGEVKRSAYEISKNIVKQKKIIEELEEHISQLEEVMKELEMQLSKVPSAEDFFKLTTKHRDLSIELANTIHNWEQQSLVLAELEALQGK